LANIDLSYAYPYMWAKFYHTYSSKWTENQFRVNEIADRLIYRTLVENWERGARLKDYPNVVGIGVTSKMIVHELRVLDLPCLGILVRRKIENDELPSDDRLPSRIDGIDTDVIEVGNIHPSHGTPSSTGIHHDKRERPAQPGLSIGHHQGVTSGTFGCVVQDKKSNEDLVLSNHHILTKRLNLSTGNDAIVQPGPTDKGVNPSDQIANLERFLPINPGCLNPGDAALARPVEGEKPTSTLAGLPYARPRGICKPYRGQPLYKVGRTTGYTTGSVMLIYSHDGPMNYFGLPDVQIVCTVTTAMTNSGDSGSVALDNNSDEASLLFYGNGGGDSYHPPLVSLGNTMELMSSLLNFKI
jgi:hypothetical protein